MAPVSDAGKPPWVNDGFIHHKSLNLGGSYLIEKKNIDRLQQVLDVISEGRSATNGATCGRTFDYQLILF